MFGLSASLVALALSASSALAFVPDGSFPSHNHDHSTHTVRSLPNGVTVKAYHPKSTYELFPRGTEHPLSKRGVDAHWKDAGLAYLGERLGNDTVYFKSGFTGKTASHVYAKQQVNGIPVANMVAHTSLNKDGKVIAFSSNFATKSSFASQKVADPNPSVSSDDAATKAIKFLQAHHVGQPPALKYLALENGDLALTHVVRLTLDGNGHLVDAFVNAHTKDVEAINDYTVNLALQVIPLERQDPSQGVETIQDPADTNASPDGWTSRADFGGETHMTYGNNVVTYEEPNYTSGQSGDGEFIFQIDDSQDPTEGSNLDAARANAFYLVNRMHDILYRYGFTEEAFNFQDDNHGHGGADHDLVTVSVHDPAGTNNADFSTPPDGTSGHMRMYIWDITSPRRDGALENDIVVHELTHGLTNRMVGGGTGACLQTTEAGGLGEGWSDAMAEWTEQTSDVHDFTMGMYVVGNGNGIRSHPYSRDQGVNPLTYGDLGGMNEPHAMGEVWANVLHNVLAALVDAHGWADDAKTNPDAEGGNAVYLHLFIDALPLTPCNPTFPDARAAWIQADENRYGGANKCALWKAFASRGLGTNAGNYQNDNSVPDGC
ncbi:putative extracellular elastinolytic metallo proteinase precursor [Exidia glandulosa HHB12029]|uniref:Extracellular metalloproteinase n=1 Tax=Exidia glandulosa HHB12029 TaxID=1314781 RepID=A0A165L5W1_EXIGL|nr:putative extracellular elastinolytic metallo proteinase precursor [Exidia glandulosa HHB12029]